MMINNNCIKKKDQINLEIKYKQNPNNIILKFRKIIIKWKKQIIGKNTTWMFHKKTTVIVKYVDYIFAMFFYAIILSYIYIIRC